VDNRRLLGSDWGRRVSQAAAGWRPPHAAVAGGRNGDGPGTSSGEIGPAPQTEKGVQRIVNTGVARLKAAGWTARNTPYRLTLVVTASWFEGQEDAGVVILGRSTGAKSRFKSVKLRAAQVEPLCEAPTHALESAPEEPVGRDERWTGMVHSPEFGNLLVGWMPYEWGRVWALAVRQLPPPGQEAQPARRQSIVVPRYEADAYVEWLLEELAEFRGRG